MRYHAVIHTGFPSTLKHEAEARVKGAALRQKEKYLRRCEGMNRRVVRKMWGKPDGFRLKETCGRTLAAARVQRRFEEWQVAALQEGAAV